MSLPHTGHEHHERIREHVDRLPGLADMLEQRPVPAEFAPRWAGEYDFITGTLWPHVEVVETTVYPELERLMQNRHSMAPMRREHAELGRIIEAMGTYQERLDAGPLTAADALGLRRWILAFYALVKTHIAEETEYLRILEGHLSPEEQDVIVAGLSHAVRG
jgi:hypothetical protein